MKDAPVPLAPSRPCTRLTSVCFHLFFTGEPSTAPRTPDVPHQCWLEGKDHLTQSADSSQHIAAPEAADHLQLGVHCPSGLFLQRYFAAEQPPECPGAWGCISLKRQIFLLPPFAHHEIIPSPILQHGKVPLILMLILPVLIPLQTCRGCTLSQCPGHGWHDKCPMYFPLCKPLVITTFWAWPVTLFSIHLTVHLARQYFASFLMRMLQEIVSNTYLKLM